MWVGKPSCIMQGGLESPAASLKYHGLDSPGLNMLSTWVGQPKCRTEKAQTRKGFSEGTATAQEMLGWKKASKETLNVEDFDFENETPDEAEEDDPLGLALSNKKRKGQGQRGRKGRKGRKEGKVGHRKPGHPMQTSS